MIKRMLTLSTLPVIMATTIFIITACDYYCDRTLYNEGCPADMFKCCSTGIEEDCTDGSGEGHWTCCNNEECKQ